MFEIRVSGSEWAVAHAACGCDCGQGSGDSGHDDLQDDFPDVVLFHHIIYNLTIYNLRFIYYLAIWLFFSLPWGELEGGCFHSLEEGESFQDYVL